MTSVSLDPSPWIFRSSTTSATYSASLTASAATVPHTGGTVNINLNGGTAAAGRPYILAASGTGVTPGSRSRTAR